jgi:hypothetical protein
MKDIDVRYSKDDGLYYIYLNTAFNIRRSAVVSEDFFDDELNRLDARERLKINFSELSYEEIDKVLEKVLAYKENV